MTWQPLLDHSECGHETTPEDMRVLDMAWCELGELIDQLAEVVDEAPVGTATAGTQNVEVVLVTRAVAVDLTEALQATFARLNERSGS